MSDIKIIYLSLRAVLFAAFIVGGYYLSKSRTEKQYWLNALLPLFAFAVISGLRFGRDIDYNGYYFRYINDTVLESYEYMFVVIVKIFRLLHVPYYCFIMFCSVFLLFSFLFLLRKFKVAALFILPLFLCVEQTENYIRWYLAFSFIMLAVTLLMESKYAVALILAIVAYFVHEGMLVPIGIILLFYFVANKALIPPYIAVGLFVIMLYFSDAGWLVNLTNWMSVFDVYEGSERAQMYINKIPDIASGNFGPLGLWDYSYRRKFRLLLAFIFPLCLGIRYFSRNRFYLVKDKKWIYNLAVCTIISLPLFTRVEIFDRFVKSLMVFSYIFIGISLTMAYKQRLLKPLAMVCLAISFLFAVGGYFSRDFNKQYDTQMLFIWDAHGRNYLP